MEEKIPHYINEQKTNTATTHKRKLYRPTISYAKAILYVVVHVAMGFLFAIVWNCVENKGIVGCFDDIKTKLLIVIPIMFLLTLRFSFIWFVKLYQRYAKSETRLRCCMTPSCSEYAILAFKKYGALWGGIKTWKRLLRCHSPGEIDYP